MNRSIFKLSLLLLFSLPAITIFGQSRYNAPLLDTLQQIFLSPGPAHHFARLYYKAIEGTNKYATKQPDSVRQFIFGFEASFAPVFFRSSRNYEGGESQTFSWERYYKDTSLSELQFQFMGMNAHINGDMWIALKNKYGYDTLLKYKKPLLHFQKALNVFFDSLYNSAKQYKRLRELHWLSLGLDKWIGRQMIYHWRKRQVNLALLFYTKPRRCALKWKHLQHRMLRWDRFAYNWIR